MPAGSEMQFFFEPHSAFFCQALLTHKSKRPVVVATSGAFNALFCARRRIGIARHILLCTVLIRHPLIIGIAFFERCSRHLLQVLYRRGIVSRPLCNHANTAEIFIDAYHVIACARSRFQLSIARTRFEHVFIDARCFHFRITLDALTLLLATEALNIHTHVGQERGAGSQYV